LPLGAKSLILERQTKTKGLFAKEKLLLSLSAQTGGEKTPLKIKEVKKLWN